MRKKIYIAGCGGMLGEAFKNVFSEFMRHYIRGIATNKGLEYLKELTKTDTNNPFI